MRKEIMDSLRAELLQNDLLQSRVTQLEDKVAQLEGAERENSELKQRCDALHHSNSMLLRRQLRGEDQIFSLQGEIESLRFSLYKAEKKSNYLQAVSSNQQWQYPVAVPTMVELLSLNRYRQDVCQDIINHISYMKDITTKLRMGKVMDHVCPGNAVGVHEWYDGYLPHFIEFADALKDYQHTIDYMNMDGKKFIFEFGNTALPLPMAVMNLLEDALQKTHFSQLIFHRLHFGRWVGYIDFMASCIKVNVRLEVLHLLNVETDYSTDVDLLCDAINSNGSLQEIQFSQCGTPEGSFREIFSKLKINR